MRAVEKAYLQPRDEVILCQDVGLLQLYSLVLLLVQQCIQLDHITLHVANGALDIVHLPPLSINLT